MSYQVLARKWRPHSFEEMVGQENILRMLTNALDQQRLHHAYLFAGSHGVGKTSLGRIFAKCLNCETGITSKPCGSCSTCQAIDSGRFLDLIEIDAASRTRVEDTREMLDNVQYAPSQGRFKIYLIDEVHMLSGHSFNALLKTLEEPPAHVKFLLATTDPKRLPVTVLSRCLQFNLKRVPTEQITQQLRHICTTEIIEFEATALNQIANAANGSMRDALSLLDQAIAFCGNPINTVDVNHMLGNIEQESILQILDALMEEDGKKLLAAVNTLAELAPDFDQVLKELLSCLHQIAVAQVTKISPPIALGRFIQRIDAETIQLYYQIALIGRRDLPLAPSPVLGLEMIVLRMLAFKPAALDYTPKNKPAKVTAAPLEPQPLPQPAATITPATSDNWEEILPCLGLTGMSYTLASHCILESLSEKTLTLTLSKKHEAFLNNNARMRIEETLVNYFKRPMDLHINLSLAELNTAAKQQADNQNQRQTHAFAAIKADDQVQKIMDVFGATLDERSIKPLDPVS